jgi:hypothetical protein
MVSSPTPLGLLSAGAPLGFSNSAHVSKSGQPASRSVTNVYIKIYIFLPIIYTVTNYLDISWFVSVDHPCKSGCRRQLQYVEITIYCGFVYAMGPTVHPFWQILHPYHDILLSTCEQVKSEVSSSLFDSWVGFEYHGSLLQSPLNSGLWCKNHSMIICVWWTNGWLPWSLTHIGPTPHSLFRSVSPVWFLMVG